MLNPSLPYKNTGTSSVGTNIPNINQFNNPILKPKIPTDTPLSIFEIKIKLDTNIAELTSMPLTRQMLYVPPELKDEKKNKPALRSAPVVTPPPPSPSATQTQKTGGQLENIYDLNDNPFFTFSVEYPIRLMKTYSYEKAIQFFFNSKIFSEVLTEEYLRIKRTSGYDETKENTYERRNEIVEKNILTMLTMLLPTKQPVLNDITTSYDFIMKKLIQFKIPTIQTTLPVHYSFLKMVPYVNDKVFTVNKVIWVNDFLNNPYYRDIVNSYNQNTKNLNYQLKENEISINNYKQKIEGTGQPPNKTRDFEKKITELENQNKKIMDSIENPFESMRNVIKQMATGNHKSSNVLLQNLLDEKVTKDEFNTFLKYLSNFVSNGETSVSLSEEEQKEFQTMMNVGVTYIQESSFQNYGNRQSVQPKKIESIEINVFVNLFDKELNEKFDISQDCDFKNEFLGNELQEYLYEKQEVQLSKNKSLNLVAAWDIHRNRPIIHLGEKYFNLPAENTRDVNPNLFNNMNSNNSGESNGMNPYPPSEESIEMDNWLLNIYKNTDFSNELNNFQTNGFFKESNFIEYLKRDGFAELLTIIKEFYKTTKSKVDKTDTEKQNVIAEISSNIRKLKRGYDIKLDEYQEQINRDPRNADFHRGLLKYSMITKFCDLMVETVNKTLNKIKTTDWNGWNSAAFGGKKRKSRKQSKKRIRRTQKTKCKRKI